MATTKPTSLPVLSLKSPTLPTELYQACRDHGFFYLTDHGIPTAALDEVLDLARQFFIDATPEQKSAVQRKGVEEGGDGARGYQRIGENVTKGARDWHEAVDFYREWEDGGEGSRETNGGSQHELLEGPNLWPDHPPELHGTYQEYIESVKEIATKVVRAMGEALGLEGAEKDTFVKATRDSFWVMRMIGYPPLQDGATEGVSCGEHTGTLHHKVNERCIRLIKSADYGCVTLLLSDSTPNALQVQLKDGSWLTANPIPGAFVINIGDMIERWTNGEWKSTNHRVVHQGSNFRVSVPFFFEPDFDATVKPLETCIKRTGGEARFDEVVYGDHLLGKIRGNFY
jgi:isopenicillin N synthase-like dioxygenase